MKVLSKREIYIIAWSTVYAVHTRSQGYKKKFILHSAEHKIYPAYKCYTVYRQRASQVHLGKQSAVEIHTLRLSVVFPLPYLINKL